MLDFYFAATTIATAECGPDETMYIGSINLDQHSALQPTLVICERSGVRLPYFEDSSFTKEEVKTLLECLRSNKQLKNLTPTAGAALASLDGILRKVVDQQTGMQAVCD